MRAQIPYPDPGGPATFAALNHNAMVDARVLTVSLVGAPGCGKTTLIGATAERLMPDVHVGAMTAEGVTHRDADRIAAHGAQVAQVNVGEGGALGAREVHDALTRLDLDWVDVLFIENAGALGGPEVPDLGQSATALVLSVTSGDDKADKHPAVVRAADVIVLNKLDLIGSVPFDLPAFLGDVRRINPRAEVIEVSSLHGEGMDRWVDWLRGRASEAACSEVSHWFG